MSTLLQGLAPTRVALENGAVVLAQGTATHPAVTLWSPCARGAGTIRPSGWASRILSPR